MENATSTSSSAPAAVGSVDNIRAAASDRRTRATTNLVFRTDDTLVIRGWIAASPHAATATQRVRVAIDGTIDAQVAAGLARGDVAEAFAAANLERSGFVAVVAAARLTPGEHTMSVAVEPVPGAERLALPTVYPLTIVASPVSLPDLGAASPDRIGGSIDTWTALPRADANGVATLDVFVRGWACDYDTMTPVSDVFAIVDGRHTGRALMGYPRPDVAEMLGASACEACGYRLRMILPATVAGGGEIAIVAVSSDRTARSTIVSPRSSPRLPPFRGDVAAAPLDVSIAAEGYERLVLQDVLDLDRERDERHAVTRP